MLVATMCALVGVVSTALGAGIGIRHIQKNGLGATALLGLAALLAGLVLLGCACVTSWRSGRGWQRLWFLPAVLLSLVIMWSFAIGAMLAIVPRTALGALTPADRGLSYTDVSFGATDGVRLSAWLIPATNHAAIVLLHGAGSNRIATLPQAVVLAHHGYGVLLLDAHGQGRSGGAGMDAGWFGEDDVRAAITFLGRQSGVDPDRIGVLGLSMGGEEAIGAAGADPRIHAVVAEGATARTAADKAGWLPGGISGFLQRGIDRLTYAVAGLLTSAPRPASLRHAIAHSGPTPFLLITAGKVNDEKRSAIHLAAAAPGRVRVWTVPGASHTDGLHTRPREWEARVVGFLDHALRG